MEGLSVAAVEEGYRATRVTNRRQQPELKLKLLGAAVMIHLLGTMLTNSAILGWLQIRQRLGQQWNRLARRDPAVLPRASRHRKGIQRKARCASQEVL